jgi:hypothetical protein
VVSRAVTRARPGKATTATPWAATAAAPHASPRRTFINPIFVTLSNGTINVNGELTGIANYSPLVTASCPAGLGAGPEAVYAVSVTEQGHVTAYLPSASNNFNTILYSRLTEQQSSQPPATTTTPARPAR